MFLLLESLRFQNDYFKSLSIWGVWISKPTFSSQDQALEDLHVVYLFSSLFLGILNHEYGDFSMLMRVIISSSFLFLCFLLFVSLLITFSFMFCGASIIPKPSFHCWSCDRNTICRLLYDIDLHHCREMMRSVGILWYLVTTICFSVEGVSVTVTLWPWLVCRLLSVI